MAGYGQDILYPIIEKKIFQWTTMLPLPVRSPPKIGPNFYFLSRKMCLCARIYRCRRMSVELLLDGDLTGLDFEYDIEVLLNNGRRYVTLFDSFGRYSRNSKMLNLLGFDLSELSYYEVDFEENPVTMVLTLRDYNNIIPTLDKCFQTPLYLDKWSRPGCLTEVFKSIFEGLQEPDLILKCGEEVLRGHNFVFQARSPVFAATKKYDKELVFNGISSTAFHDLVSFVYTDRTSELDYERAKELFKTADFYDMKGLKAHCRSYLADHLTKKGSCDILRLAMEYDDDELKELVIQYILTYEVYRNDDTWITFCAEQPVMAVSILNRSYRQPKRRRHS